MSDYITAYRNRVQSISELLIATGQKFVNEGFYVFKPKTGLCNFIVIIKGTHHIICGFTEVPYRFYLSAELIPSKERGSGYTVKTNGYNSNDDFFTMDEIKENFKPYPFNPDLKAIEKKYWYLERIN